MRMLRHLARKMSFPLIALLLFSQLATAAYACPTLDLDTAPATQHVVSMGDCHGTMDVERPNLCKSHHDAYAQASSKSVSLDVPALVAVVLAVALAPEVSPRTVAPVALEVVRPPGGPPLYLLHSNFRN